jgi:hypothetical protein
MEKIFRKFFNQNKILYKKKNPKPTVLVIKQSKFYLLNMNIRQALKERVTGNLFNLNKASRK